MPKLSLAALAALVLFPAHGTAQTQIPVEKKRVDMTFVALDTSAVCSDCSIVQASGSFTDKTIEAYYDFIWRGGFKKNVFFVFDSPGGNMRSAMRLGQILRNLNARTVVGRAVIRAGQVEIEPGYCASACVDAFLGGAIRSMPKDSKLGVHSWMPTIVLEQERDTVKKTKPKVLDRDVIESLHRQTAVYLKFIEAMGVDPKLAVLTLQTSYRSIAWVNPGDQVKWRIVTPDSCLSMPADRRWPVLLLRQVPPTAPAESPTRDTASAKVPQAEKGLAFRGAISSKRAHHFGDPPWPTTAITRTASAITS